MENKTCDFMSDLIAISKPSPSLTSANTKSLLEALRPPLAPTTALPVDRIQPSLYKEPKIQHLIAGQLTSNSKQTTFTKTSYAKPYYFAHIRFIEKKLPYVIKERCEDEVNTVHAPKLLFGAQFELEPNGVLKQTPEGLVYLQISNEYIHQLYPFFYPEGAEIPPYIAHIPVISEEEQNSLQGPIDALGKRFSFTVKECQKVISKQAQETLWILTVDSPELSLLRERYSLSSKLHSREFAIVIAVKPNKNTHKEHEHHFFRINPASSFA